MGIEEHPELRDRAPIERAASLLNRFFRTGVAPTADELGDAEAAVVAQLRHIRDDAAEGRYSFGAISVGDVAVALALHAGMSSIWPAITDFLLDRRVNRDDKDLPLERLAAASSPLPPEVLRAVGSALDELLASRSIEPFGQEIQPFPAALRLAAAHSLISDERLLGLVSQLAGSPAAAGRAEAARTLSVVARRDQDADWAAALTLQLSHDGDPLVRGESGRTLAILTWKTVRHGALAEQRLLELLADDGLIVPVLVLRGLQRDDGQPQEVSTSLARRVAELAISHPARGVRLQAEALLDEGQRSG